MFPPDWSRFRDDCSSIWFESVPSLLKFTEWLNSLGNSITFTVKYSDVQLEVLDILLFIVNRRIKSKIYFKLTHGHMYLLPQSSHHKSLCRNIPFGVALRLRRICSRDDWLDEQLQEIKHLFQYRRYNNNIINRGFNRAKNIRNKDHSHFQTAQKNSASLRSSIHSLKIRMTSYPCNKYEQITPSYLLSVNESQALSLSIEMTWLFKVRHSL